MQRGPVQISAGHCCFMTYVDGVVGHAIGTIIMEALELPEVEKSVASRWFGPHNDEAEAGLAPR
jgi:uncharacterized membrane protein YeaQ/YmgE (transglycosylase-associated protein family)